MGFMESATAGENIRKLRQERGLTQEQLAARVSEDTSIATISKLETGKMALTVEWISSIAKALLVSPHDIITESEHSPVRFVPIIGYIAASNWNEAVTHPQGWMPIPSGFGGPNCFALKPIGDSMNELVNEEGYIVVDPDKRSLVDGKVYAMRNAEGETTFKRYKSHPPSLIPCSTNPEHQPIPIGEEPFSVIGRVIWVGYQP
jgi:repressor LexA